MIGRTPVAAVALALGLLAVAAYLPALHNDFVAWDDNLYVVDNPVLPAPDGMRQIWTTRELPPDFPNYPLVFTSYWFEYRLWGLQPFGYHATNVVLHGFNTALVFALLLAMGFDSRASALTAALFAVHPMQVESVAWISERKTVLSACFCLLTFLAWLRYRRTRRWGWYLGVIVCFMCALLSKTTAVVLPLSIVAFEWVRDRRSPRRSLVPIAPLLALGLVAGLAALGAERQPASEPVVERVLVAAAALWFYVGKLLVPAHLLPLYPRWSVSASDPVWWLPLGAAVVVAFAVSRRHGDWRVRWGLAHFVVLLLPVLGLRAYGFNEYSFVSDRNVYLACVGVLVLVAGVLTSVPRFFPRGGHAAELAVLAGMLAVTWTQIPVWRDSVTLWTAVLAGNPAVPVAHANLALHFFERKDLAAAEGHVRQALELRPDLAELHKDLALVLREQGRLTEAEAELRRAQELHPRAMYQYLLGTVLVAQHRPDAAIKAFEAALAIAPDLTDAREQLTALRQRSGGSIEDAR